MKSRVMMVCAVAGSLVGMGSAAADVRLPAILTSNMVVQQGTEVAIWGWADAGEKVTVNAGWTDQAANATADADGRWLVKVRTPQYLREVDNGKPVDPFKAYTITIAGKNTITLQNVLIGEVWVCSGQSNMEMPVGDKGGGYRGVMNWEKEASEATNGSIRLFTVENVISKKAEEDCRAASLGKKPAGWVECSPTTVVDFSGTGYFFARDVAKELKVPVGIISADWGGTPAQAWTSADGLRDFPEYREAVEWVKADGKQKGENPLDAWWKKLDEADRKGMKGASWSAMDFDDSGWGLVQLPGVIPENFDGTVWLRRSVFIDETWAGKDLTLSLGPIDDMDSVYFDGELIGSTYGSDKWFHPRTYTIPKKLVKKGGAHTLAIRVLDVSGPGGANGEASQMYIQPVGDDGTRASIAGYWRQQEGMKLSDLPSMTTGTREFNAHTPTSLYNGMIAPLKNFAIRGAIWYQGESNRGQGQRYAELMRAMITDWRTSWNRGAFPFYFVQIAPFRYGGDKGQTAELRDAQRQTQTLENTGMAVTMDIGNAEDIHPNNKQDVGNRLARWALAKTYERTAIEYSGPIVREIKAEGGSLRVTFDHAKGLTARGGAPTDLEIAGADGGFVAATGKIEGEELVVSAPSVGAPVRVRYGWCNECAPNVFNGAGLPMAPFSHGLTRK